MAGREAQVALRAADRAVAAAVLLGRSLSQAPIGQLGGSGGRGARFVASTYPLPVTAPDSDTSIFRVTVPSCRRSIAH